MKPRAACVLLSCLLFACGGAASPSTPSHTASEPTPGSAAPPAAPLTDVVLVHGRMTSVMDSPVGQRNKAAQAVESSDLARQLAALGLKLQYRFDESVGDDVVVTTLEGHELGRATLEVVERGPAPADLVARIKALASPR